MRENAPPAADILAIRKNVQAFYSIGIGAAQLKCAEAVHSTPGAWAQWETGERRMHPSMYVLIQLRTNSHPAWKLTAK